MARWLVALALLTLLATGVGMFWWVRGSGSSGSSGGSAGFTHMHCPDCFLELPYDGMNSLKPCPHCGPTGPKLVPTAGRRGESLGGGPVGPMGRVLGVGTIALVIVQAVLYAWLL